MGYLVAHARKIKTPAGLRNVAEHNSRTNVYAPNGSLLEPLPPWLTHPERSSHNVGDFLDPSAVLKRHRERLASVQLTRKPQKNAAAAIEFVISASPGSISKAADWRHYFDDCKAFLARRYGGPNMVQATTHFDEKTPHMHVLMVPLIALEDGRHRYSSSEFLGGRDGLRQLQTDLAEQVGKKYGLERGVEGSKARHTDQAEFAAQNQRKYEELKAGYYALQKEREELETDKAAWAATVKVLKERPGAQLGRFVGGYLYGVDEKDYQACWDAFGAKSEELRKARMAELSRGTKGKNADRGR